MAPTPDRNPPPRMARLSPSFCAVWYCYNGFGVARLSGRAYCWSYWVSGEGHAQVRAPPCTSPWFYHSIQYHSITMRWIYHTIPYHTIASQGTPVLCMYPWFYHSIPCADIGVRRPPAVCQPLLVTLAAAPRGKLLVTAACEIQIAIHRGQWGGLSMYLRDTYVQENIPSKLKLFIISQISFKGLFSILRIFLHLLWILQR